MSPDPARPDEPPDPGTPEVPPDPAAPDAPPGPGPPEVPPDPAAPDAPPGPGPPGVPPDPTAPQVPLPLMFQAGAQVTVLEARQRCYMPRLAFGFPKGVVQEFDVATRTYTVLPADSGRPQTRILEWAVVAHVDNSVEAQTRNGQLSGVGAKLVVEAQHRADAAEAAARADAAEAASAAATEARQGRLVLATGFAEYCGCPVGLLRAAKKPKRLIFFIYYISVAVRAWIRASQEE